jgi:hypothetical protein
MGHVFTTLQEKHPFRRAQTFLGTTTVTIHGVHPRIWHPYPSNQQFCFYPGETEEYIEGNTFPQKSIPQKKAYLPSRGIVFLKPMKVGGPSASGINLRLV